MPPDPVSTFHRFCLQHPRETLESVMQVERMLPGLHALFGRRPTPFTLTPFLRSPRFFREMSALCRDLAEILEEVGHRAMAGGALLDAYQFPRTFLDVLAVHPGYPRLAPILRLDGHFVNGVFRLVETNADGSAGMNDSNAIESAVRYTPVYESLARQGLLESLDMVDPLARLLAGYARRAGRISASGAPGAGVSDAGRTRIGILDLPGVSTASEFVAVQERLQTLGIESVIVTPADLSFRRGLWANGIQLDLIYRRLVTADAFRIWSKLSPLLTAYRHGHISMVGSFRSELLHNKAILALLHDPAPRARMNAAARKLIDRHVPKAVLLTKAEAEAAASSRRRWVIKPIDAYGSRGVAVGRMSTPSAWKRSLRRAIEAGRYLLQEFVPASREPVLRIIHGRPRLSREMTSVGFFLYNGKMAGPYVRSGPVHPLSISYGAVTRPSFVFRRS